MLVKRDNYVNDIINKAKLWTEEKESTTDNIKFMKF